MHIDFIWKKKIKLQKKVIEDIIFFYLVLLSLYMLKMAHLSFGPGVDSSALKLYARFVQFE